MKKLLKIIILSFLLSGNLYADSLNPTNLWLSTQDVNSLTQVHGFQLVNTIASPSQFGWTLIKSKSPNFIKDNNIIIIVCYAKNETEKTTCWLP